MADTAASAEGPAWIPCPGHCDEFWCTVHQQHVWECPCPPIEEWSLNPYRERAVKLPPPPFACGCGAIFKCGAAWTKVRCGTCGTLYRRAPGSADMPWRKVAEAK